jgi:multidrug transporter EmrE-like cation transporter
MSAWILLFIAIATETIGSSALKVSDGFRNWKAVLIMLACYSAAFFLMSQALLEIPLSITYTVWAGLGVVGTALVGIIYFKEKLGYKGIAGMVLVILGTVILNLSS